MATSLAGIAFPNQFSNYSSKFPQRQAAPVHEESNQAKAFDKALHGTSTHGVENHTDNYHGSHCCCCCCGGGHNGGGSMSSDSWEAEAKLARAEKKLAHAIKKADKEEEYWQAYNESVFNNIFQRGMRMMEHRKEEGEKILEQYLNPPKSNKRHS